MTLLFFAVLAPLFSFRWRRLAALFGGIGAEIFFPIPFGAILGLFLFIVFFIELLERRLITKEAAGWAVAALGAIGIASLGEGVFVIAFDHAPFSLALALFATKFIVGAVLIGFFWTPVKLHLAHDKQR